MPSLPLGPGRVALGWGRAVFPQPIRDLCSSRSAWEGTAPQGDTSGDPAPAQAGGPGLATRRPFSQAGCSSHPHRGCPPIRVAAVAGRHRAKQCWPLQTWRRPQPRGRCKEPNPLIRTGRLGRRPPQARADFSGRKTCKVFPVCSPGMQPAGALQAVISPCCRPGRCSRSSTVWGQPLAHPSRGLACCGRWEGIVERVRLPPPICPSLFPTWQGPAWGPIPSSSQAASPGCGASV